MAAISLPSRLLVVTDSGGAQRTILLGGVSLPGLTDVWVSDHEIAADATVVLWDAVAGIRPPGMNSFSFLALTASGDLDVELTTNEGDANEIVSTVRLVAGVPLMLGSDDAYDASDLSGGEMSFSAPGSVINRIRVDEPNGEAVNLTVVMASG